MKVEEVDVKVVLGRSNQMSKQNLLCWNKLCNCLRIDPQVSSEKIERGNLEFGGVKHQEAAHCFHYYWSLQAHHQQISCMCAVEHQMPGQLKIISKLIKLTNNQDLFTWLYPWGWCRMPTKSSTARAEAIGASPGRVTVHCWSKVRLAVDCKKSMGLMGDLVINKT